MHKAIRSMDQPDQMRGFCKGVLRSIECSGTPILLDSSFVVWVVHAMLVHLPPVACK